MDLKFLVVDDFSTMRRILVNIISESGYGKAEEASDGNEALEKLKSSPYDFVVTDINMPNMNGFDLLQRVKADERLKHIPVLLVTAEGRKEDIMTAAKMGAAGYIVKPFTKPVLQEKVHNILVKFGHLDA
jgi:two-component system chemotaxis response regulator CheY